jgi:uncharacterized protein (TIGR02099 family)
MIHHIKRATRHLIFWSLIAMAIGLTGVRLLLSGIDTYKSDVAAKISEHMGGAPVKIGHIRAKMRGFSPELVLTEIAISSLVKNEKPAILQEIRLGLNFLDALIGGDLLSSSWVTLVGAKLSVRRKLDGSFAVVGLKASDEQPLWLLQGGKYEVLQSEILWQDEKNRGRLIKLSDVNVAIMNDGGRHRINGLMKLPKIYGDRVRVSMELEGNVFEPSAIQGVVFVEGEKIQPADLLGSELPFNIKISSGSGDIKIWSKWQHSQPVSMQGVLKLQPLKLLRQDKGMLAIKKLEAEFKWTSNESPADVASPWQLDVSRFKLDGTGSGKNLKDTGMSGAFNLYAQRSNEKLLPKIGVFLNYLDLQEASSILQFLAPLSDEQMSQIKQAQLKGALENFSLFTDLQEKTTAINGKFVQLNVASKSADPGLEGLNGYIKGTDEQGMVHLLTENGRFNAVGMFRDVLVIKKLYGTLAWLQTEENWTISGNDIELDSPDILTKSRLQMTIPKNDSPPFLDMQMSFIGNDVSKVWHYLPVGILNANTINWLDHAFISGQVPKGGMLFHGKPQDFPFKHGEGVFETLFDIDNVELSYHPEWPHLTGINAEVLFYREGLQVNLNEGMSNKVKINQAEVTIPNLNNSKLLFVLGGLESGIANVLGFLQQTPLKSRIDPVLDAITPEGDTQIALDLKIPLVAGLQSKVDGTAQLNNGKFDINSLSLPVTRIQGQLKFNEAGIYSDSINATALGYPIQISITNAAMETVISVMGRTGIGDLKKQFKLPWWDMANGAADYSLQLSLPHGSARGNAVSVPVLTVQSKLAGMALDLPNLLAKTKEQQNALSLKFKLVDKGLLMPLEIYYDKKLKAALKLNIHEQSIYSGHIVMGDGDVVQRKEAGLNIEINRDQMPLQDWVNLAAQTKNTKAISDIREIKVHSDHALWNKASLGVFDLALKQESNQWSGSIGSIFASGKIKIPALGKDADKIELDMDMLDISALKQVKFDTDQGSADVLPKNVPLFNIFSKKTLWKSINLGSLSLETERVPEGMGFKRIELSGEDSKLSMSGDWTVKGQQSATHTKGRLEMAKAGQLLAQLGLTKDFAETSAAVDFNIDWAAPPYGVSLAALKGQLDVKLKNGRILSIEPGFGRVLGVLAMAQWIKRLQLDFSDIYEEGLTFNTIEGRFDLLEGKAITNNLVVDAIPAKITITGNTDFVGRTVDHIVNVAPKSADAVPIAGTIMGKVAKLLARSLTGQDHEGFLFGSQYLVKGDWGNALIIPIHENDGLLQKTWNGITTFPWMENQKQK